MSLDTQGRSRRRQRRWSSVSDAACRCDLSSLPSRWCLWCHNPAPTERGNAAVNRSAGDRRNNAATGPSLVGGRSKWAEHGSPELPIQAQLSERRTTHRTFTDSPNREAQIGTYVFSCETLADTLHRGQLVTRTQTCGHLAHARTPQLAPQTVESREGLGVFRNHDDPKTRFSTFDAASSWSTYFGWEEAVRASRRRCPPDRVALGRPSDARPAVKRERRCGVA